MNLTLATVPLPFKGNQLTITHQHNAIKSWTLLEPRPNIILLGDEIGTKDAASQYNAMHVPGIGVNELGDLSMRSIFRKIDQKAETDWICYIDTDVILLDDFMPTFEYLIARYHNFSTCGGRWDANIPNKVNFDSPDWRKYVCNQVFKQHNKGSDYCIYRKGFYHNIPDFSIGRGAWDGWRMGYPKSIGVPLINLQNVVKAVHQRHGHRWSNQPGTAYNKSLSKGVVAWVADADIFVTKKDVAVG
jgi:hypothetical protein